MCSICWNARSTRSADLSPAHVEGKDLRSGWLIPVSKVYKKNRTKTFSLRDASVNPLGPQRPKKKKGSHSTQRWCLFWRPRRQRGFLGWFEDTPRQGHLSEAESLGREAYEEEKEELWFLVGCSLENIMELGIYSWKLHVDTFVELGCSKCECKLNGSSSLISTQQELGFMHPRTLCSAHNLCNILREQAWFKLFKWESDVFVLITAFALYMIFVSSSWNSKRCSTSKNTLICAHTHTYIHVM